MSPASPWAPTLLPMHQAQRSTRFPPFPRISSHGEDVRTKEDLKQLWNIIFYNVIFLFSCPFSPHHSPKTSLRVSILISFSAFDFHVFITKISLAHLITSWCLHLEKSNNYELQARFYHFTVVKWVGAYFQPLKSDWHLFLSPRSLKTQGSEGSAGFQLEKSIYQLECLSSEGDLGTF